MTHNGVIESSMRSNSYRSSVSKGDDLASDALTASGSAQADVFPPVVEESGDGWQDNGAANGAGGDSAGLGDDFDDEEHGFDPMQAAHMFEARQVRRSSAGLATAFGKATTRRAISLQFEDLCMDVTNQKTNAVKSVLSDVSGCAPTGEVLAIMGSSGAGKSTLLNLLGGTLEDTGNISVKGDILANGVKRDFAKFSRYSAIVLQDDRFFPELTVRETITFSAMLRLPSKMPKEEKIERVNSIITELGLRDVQDTNVGNENVRGVSGGERKRVNIGTELVSDPSVLFLDEPTSGLDAFQAQNVMVALKILARHGRTVVCTIHQPRSDIYLMFDKLLVLSVGRLMYFGDAGDTAIDYFESVGYPCPTHFNPADFFIDLISLDARSPELEHKSRARIDKLEGAIKELCVKLLPQLLVHHKAHLDKTKSHVPDLSHVGGPAAQAGGDARKAVYQASWLQQFWALAVRAVSAMLRDNTGNIPLFVMQIVPALFVGLVWLDEGSALFDGQDVQSVAGVLFFSVIHNMFNPVFPIAQTFPVERDVVLKERMTKTYKIGPYFLSKTLVELPRSALAVMLFHVISYFMIGLREGASPFFTQYAFLLLTCGAAEGIALIVSAASKGPMEASAAVPGPLVISILFGGFFIPTEKIPVWIRWIRYLALTKYAFPAIMQVQFEDRTLCTGDECASQCNTNTSFCPQTGEEVLEFFDMNELTIAENAACLLAYCVITRLLALYLLVRNVPDRVRI